MTIRVCNGGIYGKWPGLQANKLYLDRYLAHTIDFTDIYAELLIKHLSKENLTAILPSNNYKSIGFLS